jgi:hypothetical protein
MTMALSPSSHQLIEGADEEEVDRDFARLGGDVSSNIDDDISVSESGSYTNKSKSEGSGSSSSARSSGESSASTSVMGSIARHGNKEDRRICGARCLFFFVLLVAAISLGSMVFVITSRGAQKDFEVEVRDGFDTLYLSCADPSIQNFDTLTFSSKK